MKWKSHHVYFAARPGVSIFEFGWPILGRGGRGNCGRKRGRLEVDATARNLTPFDGHLFSNYGGDRGVTTMVESWSQKKSRRTLLCFPKALQRARPVVYWAEAHGNSDSRGEDVPTRLQCSPARNPGEQTHQISLRKTAPNFNFRTWDQAQIDPRSPETGRKDRRHCRDQLVGDSMAPNNHRREQRWKRS